MAVSRTLWAWISEPRNRAVLAFVGAGAAAVIAGLWQVFLHFAPQPAPHAAPSVISAPAGIAGGNVTVNGDVNLGGAAQPIDSEGLKRLHASQEKALNAETAQLDKLTNEIGAADASSSPPAKPAH
jgi:hypothetical protein